MKIISNEKITVTNNEVFSVLLNNGNEGDVSVAEVYIRTLSNIPFSVKGFIKGDSNGATLKVMDIANFEVKDSITTAGIYQVLSGAFQKLQFTFTGAGDVVIEKIF